MYKWLLVTHAFLLNGTIKAHTIGETLQYCFIIEQGKKILWNTFWMMREKHKSDWTGMDKFVTKRKKEIYLSQQYNH